MQDMRFALRMLFKSPGFVLVAVATLALSIGANTAIYSLVSGVLLRPLPYPQPERLVFAEWLAPAEAIDSVSLGNFLYWRERSRGLESAAAYEPGAGYNLVTAGGPVYVRATRVSDGLLRTLGVNPALGREFTAADVRPGAAPAVLLSSGLWQRAFASDPEVVGRAVNLNGKQYTVSGVLPRDFQFNGEADIYVPLVARFDPADQDQNYGMVARLKPGMSLAAANQDAARIFADFRREFAASVPAEWKGIAFIPYAQELRGNLRTPLALLFGAVVLVLLIGVVNVSSLFLSRATVREGEFAVRAALGASRGRLARQMFTETAVLSVLGSVAGLLLAPVILDNVLKLLPRAGSIDLSTTLLPLAGNVKLHPGVLAFTAGITALAGLAMGVTPALRFSRANLNDRLKALPGRGASSGRHRLTLEKLMVAQMALSTVLLAGAGLLLLSLFHLRRVDPGFSPQQVMTAQVSLPAEKLPTTADTVRFQRQVLEKLRALPGVESVATTSNLPVERGLNFGGAVGECRLGTALQLRAVSPQYFTAMGIPLLRGRSFREADNGTSERVAVISARVAGQCWPGRDPIGLSVNKTRIVGVVGNTHEQGLDRLPSAAMFIPDAQMPDGMGRMVRGWFLSAFVIRAAVPPPREAVQRAIAEVDSTQPLVNYRPMEQVVADSFAVAKMRSLTVLLAAFAAVALLLAAVGVYGMMAFSVQERTRELGLRMALGADSGSVLRLIARRTLLLVSVSGAIGVAAAALGTRWMASLLFAVRPANPLALAGAVVFLALTALLASYVPARRASRVDPMVALRCE